MNSTTQAFNTQEFSEFENSKGFRNTARLNNSTLIENRRNSPLMENEMSKANQYIEETNELLNEKNTPQKTGDFGTMASAMYQTASSKFDKYGYENIS